MSEVNPIQGTTKQGAADQIADMPDEMFGDLLEGAEPEEPQEEIQEAPEEETQEVEAEEVETEETTEEAEETETEELQLETVSDMAEALGVEDNDLLDNLKTKIKVDGEESEVTLNELKNGYQKDADYRKKTAELSELRTQAQQEVQEAQKGYEQQSLQLGQYLNAVEQVLSQDVNTPEMEQLRMTNPAEWNARMFEHQNKVQTIQNIRQQAANQWAENQQSVSQHTELQKSEILKTEQDKLVKAIPDWNDSLKQEVLSYVTDNYSFPIERVMSETDHNYIVMAQKAMLYDKGQQQTEVVKKKVKTLPKVQKPSKPESKVTVKRKQVNAAKSRLKKTGHRRDAANVILESGLLDNL
tara:strand:+ start:4561 stop:5628 length:1068 start_codon:yes stop_codon:yes gene_type:complete